MKKLSTTLFIFLLIGSLSSASAEVIELRYSTYLGGTYNEGHGGLSMVVDDSGSVYLTGNTGSLFDFPVVNSYQATGWGPAPKAFVTKFGPSGSTLEYSTYLGGRSRFGEGKDLALDEENRLWVAGFTASTDFPVVEPYQNSNAGEEDGFLCRLSSNGATLEYSTYLGGSQYDCINSIDKDGSGNIYLTGFTSSENFPTFHAWQNSIGSLSGNVSDAFITKYSSSGTDLLFSTYLGGDSSDTGTALTVSSDGYALVTGYTRSSDFPTRDAYQSSCAGDRDGFLCRINPSGQEITFSTYFGGSGEDRCQGIVIGGTGLPRIGLTGFTASTDFPIISPYQSTLASIDGDAFVTLFYTWGSPYSSTYLGGAAAESSGHDIVFDGGDNIWLTGSTASPFFPTANPYQSRHGGGTDTFIARFSPSLSSLQYSSFLGGASIDEGKSIASGGNSIFITGITNSRNFPTRNSYQDVKAGSNSYYDIFLSKFSMPDSWGYDYNGDGTSDISIFRESSGLWAIRNLTRVYFGQNGDIPSPGDYDGSGTTEIAVFRPSSGLWAIRRVSRIYFGSSGDTPLPGDYDGDGIWGPAIFRENSGLWAVRGVTRIYFGQFRDTPIPGYYSDSGQCEIALFRGTSGLWAIRDISRFYFGAYPDEPIPGDYNSTGSWSGAIFRPQSGLWAIRGLTRVYFGQSMDGAYPADYRGDGDDGIAIFRPPSGLWAIRGVTRVYFGQDGDTPVTR